MLANEGAGCIPEPGFRIPDPGSRIPDPGWYDFRRMRSFPDALRRRLTAPLPGLDAQLRMAPNPRMWPEAGTELRPAAALLLIYPRNDRWHFPLTVRGA